MCRSTGSKRLKNLKKNSEYTCGLQKFLMNYIAFDKKNPFIFGLLINPRVTIFGSNCVLVDIFIYNLATIRDLPNQRRNLKKNDDFWFSTTPSP
jgi:hypothetical protein